MKKAWKLIVCAALVCCMLTPAVAESFDVSAYSYEELLAIRETVNEQIAEMERQYAIENGNRVIAFEEGELTLFKGCTQKLAPQVRRVVEDAPEKTSFVYASSDAAIAKVSAEGVVTAVSAGDAVITCTAKDDEFIFCELPVHVVMPVSAVKLDADTAALLLKKNDPAAAQMELQAVVEPKDAFVQTVSWKSSDETVATVDENGRVQALAAGSATITATSDEEPAKGKKAFSASCKVTVGVAVEEIELTESELLLNKGRSKTLKATVLPQEATKKTYTWSSTDKEVATVSKEGQVKAVGCGVCQIVCEANDGSGAKAVCDVEVIQMVTSITPETKAITMNRGESFGLKWKVAPADATNQQINWESSDSSVVEVKKGLGLLNAVGGGSCTITGTAADGSEVTASVTVYVPSISLKTKKYSVTSKNGLDFSFKYYGKRSDLSITSSAAGTVTPSYRFGEENTVNVHLTPKKYGTVTLTIKDSSEAKSTEKVTVQVEHSAVYDSVSYPKASYADILRNPSAHNGKKVRISGRVVQKLQSGSRVTLRVSTRSYSDVFYVTYDADDVDVTVIEDDRVTIYGTCKGDYTYETIFGASVTIPYMHAEKITFTTN